MKTKQNLSDAENVLLGEFYQNHFDELWRLALTIVKNSDTAYDIVQSAFEKTIGSFHNIVNPTEKVLRSYLYVAVRYTALNYVQRQKLHPIISYNELTGQSVDLMPEEYTDLESEYEELQQCIEQLKDPYKSYIQMKYYESQDNKTIAETTKKKEGSVRMIHKRAIEHLEHMMSKLEEGESDEKGKKP
jgi:RNA polymerase sigma-70 factor (ECF subfamily)